MKVLKFDGAIAPRVLKFDSGSAAEGCGRRHMDKPLWGLRVLKFDGAVAPRVLKFDSGFAAEGYGGASKFIEGALL